MHKLIVAATAALLTACATTQPPVPVLVAAETAAPVLPPECTAPDAAWKQLPDADVTRSAGVENLEENRARFERTRARRAVCRAAIQSRKGS